MENQGKGLEISVEIGYNQDIRQAQNVPVRGGESMAAIKELIRTETDGTLSFGDYELNQKTKLSDFNHGGNLYKVKTFHEITRLERNDLFVYESVPGTSVHHFSVTESGAEFVVEGPDNVQITVGLEDATEYMVSVEGENTGIVKTNLSGKLPLSVDLGEKGSVNVKIAKV